MSIGEFAITKLGHKLGYVCSINGNFIILKFHNSRECFPAMDLDYLPNVPQFPLSIIKKPEDINGQDVILINKHLKLYGLQLSIR